MLTDLTIQNRKDIFSSVGAAKIIRGEAVEKDWWVTQVLRVLFSSKYKDNIVFKGGTSLSKGWHLIERFSEDVDIAINREFLGFTGALTRTQISDKLRRASCSFVRTELREAVESGLIELGIPREMFSVVVDLTPVTTTDPEKVFIQYESVYNSPLSEYVKPKVIIEAGARSMFDPSSRITIRSFVSEVLNDSSIADSDFEVNATPAERTFLEKIFLLHEEFHKEGLVRTERMSRHLYDIERMMDTPIGQAINDKNLYLSIIEHRRRFIGLKGFDYSSLLPKTIDIVPPEEVRSEWSRDYKSMQESMIFGESPSFEVLLSRISELNDRLHSLPF